jgi:hypothetical protein
LLSIDVISPIDTGSLSVGAVFNKGIGARTSIRTSSGTRKLLLSLFKMSRYRALRFVRTFKTFRTPRTRTVVSRISRSKTTFRVGQSKTGLFVVNSSAIIILRVLTK